MFSITRTSIGICFALLASGCGGGSRPSGPTPSGSTPSGPTGSVPTGPYTITGIVADESGLPIAGASFDACCVYGFTYSHGHLHDVLRTDASGRFEMTGIPGSTRLWFRANKVGYVEQCAAAPVTVQGDVAVDLPLVSMPSLTARARSAPGFRSVSGTVAEITATDKQPVAGALVYFEAFEDFEPAATYSDNVGRFGLCGLPVDETVPLGAFVIGSRRGAYTTIPPGQTTDVELVLR